jgi:hypothetical protein
MYDVVKTIYYWHVSPKTMSNLFFLKSKYFNLLSFLINQNPVSLLKVDLGSSTTNTFVPEVC